MLWWNDKLQDNDAIFLVLAEFAQWGSSKYMSHLKLVQMADISTFTYWIQCFNNHKITMFMRRVIRFSMASENGKITKLPKAPTLLSGELENFRFDAEHQRIFDGYTLDELYGSKIGIKHSPAVQAEMRKYRHLYPETPLPPSCFSSLDSASSGTFITST